ncbi:MAG: amidohydrolase [Thermoplasmata archaeon]|nr:amidohydrolase [Thermoplasmata archaeon]
MAGSGSIAWVEGRVYTGRRKVEALLVDDGRVVVAGSSEEVRRNRPTGAEVRSLSGRVLIPGLVDSHCHLRASVLRSHGVDLSPCESVNSIVDSLREGALRSPSGPIFGWGWDDSGFARGRYPSRDDLDQVSAERSVVAYRRCLHVAAANSEALRTLQLDPSTPDPAGGRLGRSGPHLDGLFYDAGLTLLRPLEVRRFEALGAETADWFQGAARLGLTTLVAMSSDISELRRVREVFSSRSAPVRIRAYVRPDQMDGLRAEAALRKSQEIRVVGVKAFADGAFGPRTAWLSEPYHDDPKNSGQHMVEPNDLADIVREAADRQLAVAVHAIGDRAIRQTLRTFRSEPPYGTPRIEHASLTPPDLLTELTSVRPALVVQPLFRTSDTWLEERLGPERARWAYATRSLSGLGLHVAGSSDSPVETRDPWAAMASATAPRPPPTDMERLSTAEALGLYTHEGGAALGEPEIGTLEAGSFADMVVLAARDWSAALRAGPTCIVASYVGGALVYERLLTPLATEVEPAQAL